MDEEDFPSHASAFGAWTGFERDGLWAKPVEREGVCVIAARNGQNDPLRQNLRTLYDIEPPRASGCAANAALSMIAIAPQTWLLIKADAARSLATDLRAKLGSAASIMDQSGAYARLRLGGMHAQEVLQKGVFLDLDKFEPGAAATTQLAHLGTILWRPSSALIFELALFRSSARDFIFWLEHAARL